MACSTYTLSAAYACRSWWLHAHLLVSQVTILNKIQHFYKSNNVIFNSINNFFSGKCVLETLECWMLGNKYADVVQCQVFIGSCKKTRVEVPPFSGEALWDLVSGNAGLKAGVGNSVVWAADNAAAELPTICSHYRRMKDSWGFG